MSLSALSCGLIFQTMSQPAEATIWQSVKNKQFLQVKLIFKNSMMQLYSKTYHKAA